MNNASEESEQGSANRGKSIRENTYQELRTPRKGWALILEFISVGVKKHTCLFYRLKWSSKL